MCIGQEKRPVRKQKKIIDSPQVFEKRGPEKETNLSKKQNSVRKRDVRVDTKSMYEFVIFIVQVLGNIQLLLRALLRYLLFMQQDSSSAETLTTHEHTDPCIQAFWIWNFLVHQFIWLKWIWVSGLDLTERESMYTHLHAHTHTHVASTCCLEFIISCQVYGDKIHRICSWWSNCTIKHSHTQTCKHILARACTLSLLRARSLYTHIHPHVHSLSHAHAPKCQCMNHTDLTTNIIWTNKTTTGFGGDGVDQIVYWDWSENDYQTAFGFVPRCIYSGSCGCRDSPRVVLEYARKKHSYRITIKLVSVRSIILERIYADCVQPAGCRILQCTGRILARWLLADLRKWPARECSTNCPIRLAVVLLCIIETEDVDTWVWGLHWLEPTHTLYSFSVVCEK